MTVRGDGDRQLQLPLRDTQGLTKCRAVTLIKLSLKANQADPWWSLALSQPGGHGCTVYRLKP